MLMSLLTLRRSLVDALGPPYQPRTADKLRANCNFCGQDNALMASTVLYSYTYCFNNVAVMTRVPLVSIQRAKLT